MQRLSHYKREWLLHAVLHQNCSAAGLIFAKGPLKRILEYYDNDIYRLFFIRCL
jgi:hypothetical protein